MLLYTCLYLKLESRVGYCKLLWLLCTKINKNTLIPMRGLLDGTRKISGRELDFLVGCWLLKIWWKNPSFCSSINIFLIIFLTRIPYNWHPPNSLWITPYNLIPSPVKVSLSEEEAHRPFTHVFYNSLSPSSFGRELFWNFYGTGHLHQSHHEQ